MRFVACQSQLVYEQPTLRLLLLITATTAAAPAPAPATPATPAAPATATAIATVTETAATATDCYNCYFCYCYYHHHDDYYLLLDLDDQLRIVKRTPKPYISPHPHILYPKSCKTPEPFIKRKQSKPGNH